MKLQAVKEVGLEACTPKDVVDNLVEDYWTEKREMVSVVLLSTRCDVVGGVFVNREKVVDSEVATIGSLNASIMEPRVVFRLAIQENADSVIIVHNHPSGDPSPSGGDIEATERVMEAGRIIGVEVRDHIIIGNDAKGRQYFSLKAKGLLQ